MPGLPRDDAIERAAGRIPLLEARDLDRCAVPAGDRGHALVGVDAENGCALARN
ncbi:hypothetical protein WDJ51_01710 [Rathayibacter sp. YIM 133350]